MGGQVFALDDYGMRNYCFGIFSLTRCFRPVPGIFFFLLFCYIHIQHQMHI